MQFPCVPVKTFGQMTVYRRTWVTPGCGVLRYFVARMSDSKILEEFSRMASAAKWAKANQHG